MSTPNSNIEMKKTRKVLVIRLSSLGDIIHATSVFPVLEAANCSVSFAVKANFASLLKACAPKINVYAYDVKKADSEKIAREHFLQWVREQNFDCILDLHDSLRTKLWRCALGKIAPVFVAKKPRWQEFLVYFLRKKTGGLGRGGRARRMRDLAVFAVRKIYAYEYKISSPEEVDALTRLSNEYSKPSPIIEKLPSEDFLVLVPGSAWEGKRWPLEKFKKVIELWGIKSPVVILGGSEEEDYSALLKMSSKISPHSISLQGQTTLEECAQILSRAKLVLGNDTGLIHLAEALGKNVIAIEGPTHSVLGYSVYRKSSQIIHSGILCSPCSKNGRICWRWGSRDCMQRITSEEVIQELLRRWNV